VRHVGFGSCVTDLSAAGWLAHVRHVGFGSCVTDLSAAGCWRTCDTWVWHMFDRTDSATAGWLAHVRHVASLNPNIFSKNISMQHVRHRIPMFMKGEHKQYRHATEIDTRLNIQPKTPHAAHAESASTACDDKCLSRDNTSPQLFHCCHCCHAKACVPVHAACRPF
jgi:hypothetical protein